MCKACLQGASSQTWDLPRARPESPDKPAFLCLYIGQGDYGTPCAASFGDSLSKILYDLRELVFTI